MEQTMSRLLIETVVKRALEDIKENPERGIRNLIDMALQFSEGRFQREFFTSAQTMLQNENSAYYKLVRDIISHTDTQRLYTFGMNLGYNGCTVGAHRIRGNERLFGCNIPWTVAIQLDGRKLGEKEQKYQSLVQAGEKLGIYTWMLFPGERPEEALTIVKEHPDSAFILYCEPEKLTADFLDEAAGAYHLMLAVRYGEDAADLCADLRRRGMLYSVWYPYGQNDTEMILNGDLFCRAQELSPAFTALLPEPECPDAIQRLVYQTVQRVRGEQSYHTILWELWGDNRLVDAIISYDACSVYFDTDGNICDRGGRIECPHHNLFESGLVDILMDACPKKIPADSRKAGTAGRAVS